MHWLRADLLRHLIHRKRASTYKELLQREERHSKLGSTVAQMELEKAVMVRFWIETHSRHFHCFVVLLSSASCKRRAAFLSIVLRKGGGRLAKVAMRGSLTTDII